MSTPETAAPGRPGASEDDLRARVHGMWAAVAEGWAEHADYADRRGAPLTETMLDRADAGPGDAVLELACGPGGAGLMAAWRVGPSGRVVMSDVAAPMVAMALARAAAGGLANVEGRVLDLEAIAEPDESHDVVICREGLMFAVDPARAAREMLRVLRPGGRVALSVWGPRERNPWLSTVLDVVAEHLGRPVPPPGVPGPFSLSDPATLGSVLEQAGFADVRVNEQAVPLRAGSVEEWWERTTALAGPLAAIIGRSSSGDRDALRRRALDASAPWARDGVLEMPGVALVAVARRPAGR